MGEPGCCAKPNSLADRPSLVPVLRSHLNRDAIRRERAAHLAARMYGHDYQAGSPRARCGIDLSDCDQARQVSGPPIELTALEDMTCNPASASSL